MNKQTQLSRFAHELGTVTTWDPLPFNAQAERRAAACASKVLGGAATSASIGKAGPPWVFVPFFWDGKGEQLC